MPSREGPVLLSVVIPVYFNEQNIPITWAALRDCLARLPAEVGWEVVFVDDGSGDRSYEQLTIVRESDPEHVRVVKLARNFGQHAATMAGLAHARGDACVVMSADLQDPPELILEMVERWDRGAHPLVLAVRQNREDGPIAAFTSRAFYSLMRRYAIPNMPERGFDFFLADRRIVDGMEQVQDKNGFLQGQVLWAGFTPVEIAYTRRRRELGHSRWSLSMKLRYFFDGFVSYSVAPIRLITLVGVVISLMSFTYAGVIVVARLLTEFPVPGWAPLMAAILVLAGVQLVMLGIIGEYLWRTYHEIGRRPNYVVDHTLGLEDPTGSAADPGD